MSEERPTNRLADETSPYLLQHAHNPVDWYPWGDEAFARARAENKPIFLSVGYSACHWCHVMERESFESPEIAALMNEHFINVKVDREERPDVDQIYMAAVQAMNQGHGGWPMSVFLTPDGKPFFAGTYFPPRDSRGMPGFPRVLLSVAKAWEERSGDLAASAAEMVEHIDRAGRLPSAEGELSTKLLDDAVRALARAFEPNHGGFGRAPKFPHPMDLMVLMRRFARTGDANALHMVRLTLDKMARGGIYDHLGGGFARYSTDERWLVPHFEKMLYDNALLASTYTEAFQLTRDPEYARVVRETLDYILTRMTDPAGGFYATEDADSEGEEGKFYVWTLEEIREVLGADRAKVFASVYDVTEAGNWEGSTILNRPKPFDQSAKLLGIDEPALRRQLDEDRRSLLAVREKRVPPGKDTKVLASWNGLMIAAMAEAGVALGEERCLAAASAAADFILEHMRTDDGRLLHSYKDGRARFNAYLDDYACVIDGLTRLYEATGEIRRIESALALAEIMNAEFRDTADGGFYFTGESHEALIVRQKDSIDNATPSGNGMAATALVRLGAITGRTALTEAAEGTLRAVRPLLEAAPAAVGQSLIALDFLLAPTREVVVIAGTDPGEFRAARSTVSQTYDPHRVIAPSPQGAARAAEAEWVPLLADRPAIGGRTTTYICENNACLAPVVGADALREALA